MKNKLILKDTYFDYAASTPISPSVALAMSAVSGVYANPGGIHSLAVLAKNTINIARKQIATLISARPEEIIFTSSATESNLLAIRGTVEAWQENHPKEIPHIIISEIEHPSVIEAVDCLEKKGALVTKLSVDEFGVINLKELKEALKPNTVVVSVMMANNEIGTLEPIEEISKTLRHYKKEIKSEIYPLFHTDAAQAFQYVGVRVVKPEVDLLTISSSKIYGPRGIAILYVKSKTPLSPTMPGGGQENGRRGGTEATILIVGLAKAIEDVVRLREKESLRLGKILEAGKKELIKKIPEASVVGHPTLRLPNNLCFSVPGIESEYLILSLSAKKIYASSRSACSSDDESGSHVILAIRGNSTDGIVRLSFGRDTKEQDVKRAINIITEAIVVWRSFGHAHKSNLICRKK